MSITLRSFRVLRGSSRSARAAGAVAAIATAAGLVLASGSAQASTSPSTHLWSASTTAAPVLTVAPLSTTATSYTAQVLSATNAQRKAHGLGALTASSCLNGFASKWASHLAGTRTLVHQSLSPFLSTCHVSWAAENIGDGNVTAAQMVSLFMSDAAHRANVLGTHYKHLGVGAVRSGTTWYVVQDFSS
jgi:uncharacterized protein YkwD